MLDNTSYPKPDPNLEIPFLTCRQTGRLAWDSCFLHNLGLRALTNFNQQTPKFLWNFPTPSVATSAEHMTCTHAILLRMLSSPMIGAFYHVKLKLETTGAYSFIIKQSLRSLLAVSSVPMPVSPYRKYSLSHAPYHSSTFNCPKIFLSLPAGALNSSNSSNGH